jgi:hypothetical protein
VFSFPGFSFLALLEKKIKEILLEKERSFKSFESRKSQRVAESQSFGFL